MSELPIRPSFWKNNPNLPPDAWYPHSPHDLRAMLAEYLGNVPAPSAGGELLGLIAPHAGLRYSGQTAAYAYKQLQGRAPERVLLIGPSHYQDFGAQAANRSAAYETPLGPVPVDIPVLQDLDRAVGVNFISRDVEHSLEMQLPFLQHQLPKFTLVPLMMSHPFYIFGPRVRNECEELSRALAPLLDRESLIVASSDLSHLHSYEAVTYFDQRLEDLVLEYNIGALVDYMVNEGEPRACGDMAIITTLMAAQLRGANTVRVFYRTNSGDVTGLKEPGTYTVGYLAAGIYMT